MKNYEDLLNANVREEFKKLRDKWKAETCFLSDSTKMILNINYQMIIGLGPDVVPYILRDLKRSPDHWHWALRAITREDPVPSECAGDLSAIAGAWLAWGKDAGLVTFY